jgi:hypothetical protein
MTTVWTSPDDLRRQLLRLWDQGQLLTAGVACEAFFPLALRLRRPSTRELADRFDEVRAWVRDLEQQSRPWLGFGYEISWREIEHRELGRNRVPIGISVPSRSDALRLIEKVAEADLFDALARTTLRTHPELEGWMGRKPLLALEYARDWERILGVIEWFKQHPRSGLYVRQIDVAGVDTKFIEARKALLAELLDLALPSAAIDCNAVGVKGFEARYGLRAKPNLVRFRILDDRHAIAGLTDLMVPLAQFGNLAPGVRRIFITENEVNGLAFPRVESSLVIFGLGYGIETLSHIDWLHDRDIRYWGDIDTHGFAMLDRLRSRFPRAKSLLMDAETLLAHREHWSVEDAPHVGQLERLTTTEKALYDDLRFDRLGRRVRLEQERISFARLGRVLEATSG